MHPPRYICIHGHFYQPPRENPWLDVVEVQDSAAPYHDWNERITRECYAPNTRSRLLDVQGRIINLSNNYAWMSFNFGPTLLSWMERSAPEVLERIVEADRISRRAPGRPRQRPGAGLQPRHHAPGRARTTSGRRCSGASPTSATASAGIRRGCGWPRRPPTSPRSRRWPRRASASPSWLRTRPNAGGRPAPRSGSRSREGSTPRAPTRPTPFGAIAGAVLLRRDHLPPGRVRAAARQRRGVPRSAPAQGFDDRREHAQLMHIATDGESYGHHHPHGDMALAYVLHRLAQHPEIRLTNYGEFLELHPPEWEVEIHEKTAWSCATASSGGTRTAAARPGATGTRSGAGRSAGRSTSSRTSSTTSSAPGAASASPTPGRRATPTSTWSSTAARRRSATSSAATATPTSTRPRSATRSGCWRCSATRCSCTRAAAGSSTRSAGWRRPSASTTPRGRSTWRGTSAATARRSSSRRSSRRRATCRSSSTAGGSGSS